MTWTNHCLLLLMPWFNFSFLRLPHVIPSFHFMRPLDVDYFVLRGPCHRGVAQPLKYMSILHDDWWHQWLYIVWTDINTPDFINRNVRHYHRRRRRCMNYHQHLRFWLPLFFRFRLLGITSFKQKHITNALNGFEMYLTLPMLREMWCPSAQKYTLSLD